MDIYSMNANVEELFKPYAIGAVPANMIDLIWDRVEPLIKTVEEKAPDDISLEVVRERLLSGNNLLVTVSSGPEIIAVNVIDIKELDTGMKILYIPITAGTDMENWIREFLDIAKAIALDHGCDELRGMAVRDGWLKKLKPYGWEPMFTTVRCKVEK